MNAVRLFLLATVFGLVSVSTLAAQSSVRISEFMASNRNGLDDEDGDNEDWIEIHNAGSNTVNLAGWFLTDTTNNLRKWMFPAVSLARDSYLVVFASNKDRNVGELHTNFRLSDTGEYLALVQPDGVTVATEFAPAYPIQAPDVSYGLRGSTAQETLLAQGAPARALVPLNDLLEPPTGGVPNPLRPWTLEGFDDSAWTSGTTGVGYDYPGLTGLDVQGMSNINQTVYIRVPFVVSDPAAVRSVILRMRYDDGMIAYLNGREVAWDNSPEPTAATWNSGAPANRADDIAVTPRDFNISAFISFLHVGTNVLAIQGLNNSATSSDLLILPELVATISGSTVAVLRYFPIPTPGAANNAGVSQLGPIITDDDFHPAKPTDADAIRVTARIRPALGAVASAVLHYRIGFGAEVTLPFLDNGSSGDEGVGDGVFGAVIPATAHGPGNLVRWYITATDNVGGSSRLPSFVEPLDGPEYAGTVVADGGLTNPLPVLHWFVQNPAAAENDAGTRCTVYYDGELYDNVLMNLHGQSSRGFPKKSYDIDFHPGHNFKWKAGEPRADDINMLTTYPDKAHMRNVLAYGTYRDAGSAHHWVIPVRVQQNGAFWGTAHLVENGDEDWLVRMGINSQGSLYKMYNTFSSIGDASSALEKKTRKSESTADLQALFNGISQSGEARRRFVYDNIDLAGSINFLAVRDLMGDTDCCHKNYYFYRDSGQSDEWQMWPWDVDLSFGRRWIGTFSYWDQNMIVDTGIFGGGNNRFVTTLYGTPEIRQMYLRRLRTLMDEFLMAPGTLEQDLHFEPIIDALAAQVSVDARLDALKWNSHAWGNGSTAPCCAQFLPEAVNDIKNVFLPGRRTQLFNRLVSTEIPAAQPPGTVVNIVGVEANPASANQDQEYIQLRNPNAIAVDVSGWSLSGAVHFKFRGGTVIPAGGTLYLAANRKAFRARAAGPTGNNALQVVGDYEGRLSARGEFIALTDRQGIRVGSFNTPAQASAAQQYLRITEIMYHPPVLPGATFPLDDYEYVELQNVGPTELSLNGVHFSAGIGFNFTGSSVTTLSAGQSVVLVRNLAAFTQRYGAAAAARVAGVFTGALDDSGERLRLDDATNEKILEFDFNNAWYPITDGRGFALTIVDATASFETWGLKESWRPSGREYGTPGAADPGPVTVPGILVNEVLANTASPQLDAIELFNPTAAPVDVSGWYLTDDPNVPKKFRIPAATVISAGGYLVFDEGAFNATPGVPPSFSFSSAGDEAYLFSGNVAGELTGYHHGYHFDASGTGVAFGRYHDSLGREHFVAMSSNSLGASNAAPLVGPVVIAEIHYRPIARQEGLDLVENFEDEYIELLNISGGPVSMFDPVVATNTWQIRGGIEFDFPANVTLPAGGRLLVVSFDPANNPVATAAFRSRLGLAPGVLLVGPFRGQLGNGGNDIRLRRPEAPVLPPDPDAGLVPSVLVDEVEYLDDTPWPLAADGFGPSLQRLNTAAFGNDPANWTAATLSPAAPLAAGTPPAISAQPASQTVVALANVTFSVTAGGSAPLRYQWTFNGDALPGQTNSTLSLPTVTPVRQGIYRVIVLNASGSAVSSNATLFVLTPVRISQHPRSTRAHLGASVNFVVQAAGSSTVRYQWRKGGVNLAGETNTFLNFASVTAADAGTYDVVVSDAVSSLTSDPAALTVLVNPEILTQPASLNVTVQATPVAVSFSVVAASATPLRYQWLLNGGPLGTGPNIPTVTASTLNISNVSLANAGGYSVVVSDNFGSVTSQVATLIVNTRANIDAAPLSQSVPEGGTAVFSAAWSGSGPFLHRWRRTLPTSVNLAFVAPTGVSSVVIPGGYIAASSTNTVLVLTNVSLALSGTAYDIVVSNAVGQLQTDDGVLTVIADADRDGLPDSWETGRAGFSVSDPTDALRDDDGDGINNAREYFAGTDYLDGQSYLRVNITGAGPVRLTFGAAAGKTYTVQYTDSLSPIQWRNLVIEPAGANARTVTVTDPAPVPRRTYRLATPAQP